MEHKKTTDSIGHSQKWGLKISIPEFTAPTYRHQHLRNLQQLRVVIQI